MIRGSGRASFVSGENYGLIYWRRHSKRQSGDWRSQELQGRAEWERRYNCHFAERSLNKDVRVARLWFVVKLTACGAATTLKSEW